MPHPDDAPRPPRDTAPERASGTGNQSRQRADLDRVFGDVLPDTTRDERADSDRPDGNPGGDDWYHHNRPPHHGG